MTIAITDANTVDQVVKVMLTTGSPLQRLEAFCKVDPGLMPLLDQLITRVEGYRANPLSIGTSQTTITHMKQVLGGNFQAALSMLGVIDPVAKTTEMLSDENLITFGKTRLQHLISSQHRVANPLLGPIEPGTYYTRTGRPFRVLMSALNGHNCEVETVVYVNLTPTDDKPAGQVWTIDADTFRERFSNENPNHG